MGRDAELGSHAAPRPGRRQRREQPGRPLSRGRVQQRGTAESRGHRCDTSDRRCTDQACAQPGEHLIGNAGQCDQRAGRASREIDAAECVDRVWIELSSSLRLEDVQRDFVSLGGSVRTLGRDRVKRVGDRDYAGPERDLPNAQSVRIAGPVQTLVVMADDRCQLLVFDLEADHSSPVDRVSLDDRELLVGQTTGLVQDLDRGAYLADIVQAAAARISATSAGASPIREAISDA